MSVSSAKLASVRDQFGFKSFLPNQEDIIRSVLNGHDTIAILKTSGGKSACFQIPGAMQEGLTVIVSPLIELHQDQVDALERKGISATYMNSRLKEKSSRNEMWEKVTSGEAKILYVSPEALGKKEFWEHIDDMEVSLLVVDEAHCVSTWGHDFRWDYQKIYPARERMGMPTMLAVTATASVNVLSDMKEMLGLDDARVFVGELDRPELKFRGKRFRSFGGKEKFLRSELQGRVKDGEKTVIFCRTIRIAQKLHKELETLTGLRHGMYHGDLDDNIRRETAQKFRDGTINVLICTKAFGMGVDIPDIRHVYHFDLVESVEEYWQEVSRAARDGETASCTLMWQSRDVSQLKYFITGSNPSLSFIQTVWDWLVSQVKPAKWRDEIPCIRFGKKRFFEYYAGPDAELETRINAALGMLIEFELIRVEQGRLYFLAKPKEVEGEKFPISEEAIGIKRDRAMTSLQLTLHLASVVTNADSEDEANSLAHEMVMRHLSHNTLIEEAESIDINNWYEPVQEITDLIVKSLGERDREKWSLLYYLCGQGDGKGSHRGALEDNDSYELQVDLEFAELQGLIRAVPLINKMYYTLTEAGIAHLETLGVTLDQPATYAEFRRIMLTPLAKETLKRSFRNWWFTTNPAWDEKQWWKGIRDFLTEGFAILDKEAVDLAGLLICAHYFHRNTQSGKPDSDRLTASPGPDTKVFTGLKLSDVKNFLNWVFDEQIQFKK